VRAAHGTITIFDAHGAGAGQNTCAVSINDAGTVVGVYRHKSFSRSANGGASAAGIDNAEAIVGSYLDASDVSYGFLLQKLNALVPNPTRIEGGKRKCRDLPRTEWSFFRSAVFAPRRRPRRSRKTLTAPSSRSTLRGPAAAGFVRAADGTITGFGTPFGSVIVDTIATSINAAGVVADITRFSRARSSFSRVSCGAPTHHLLRSGCRDQRRPRNLCSGQQRGRSGDWILHGLNANVARLCAQGQWRHSLF